MMGKCSMTTQSSKEKKKSSHGDPQKLTGGTARSTLILRPALCVQHQVSWLLTSSSCIPYPPSCIILPAQFQQLVQSFFNKGSGTNSIIDLCWPEEAGDRPPGTP